MPINKLHDEFRKIALNSGDWRLPDGYPPGALASEKILSGELDHEARRGSRTRLLRFEPGFISTVPFSHEYWEEVLMIEGDMTVGHDGTGEGGEKFEGLTYAVRPPTTPHGPFRSDGGALLLEIHYFDPA